MLDYLHTDRRVFLLSFLRLNVLGYVNFKAGLWNIIVNYFDAKINCI